MSNAEVYDFFDYQLNTISINTAKDMKVEDVWFDDAFVDELNKGEAVGLNYGKNCPRLNYLTLGVPYSYQGSGLLEDHSQAPQDRQFYR